MAIDRRMVETAALLHDVDKALPRDHPLRSLRHGAAGAAWLTEAGHAELARALRAHPVVRLGDAAAADWVVSAPIEERIVCYADKRATQRVVSLEQRFARWERKHPAYAERLAHALGMARRLEAGICDALHISPTEVERLRWVEDALRRAEGNGSIPCRDADPDAEVREGRGVPLPVDPAAQA